MIIKSRSPSESRSALDVPYAIESSSNPQVLDVSLNLRSPIFLKHKFFSGLVGEFSNKDHSVCLISNSSVIGLSELLKFLLIPLLTNVSTRPSSSKSDSFTDHDQSVLDNFERNAVSKKRFALPVLTNMQFLMCCGGSAISMNWLFAPIVPIEVFDL